MKGKLIVITLGGLLLVGCGGEYTQIKSTEEEDSRFESIYTDYGYEVVYDTLTGAEYSVSNNGGLTLLVDSDGNPLIYEGWDADEVEDDEVYNDEELDDYSEENCIIDTDTLSDIEDDEKRAEVYHDSAMEYYPDAELSQIEIMAEGYSSNSLGRMVDNEGEYSLFGSATSIKDYYTVVYEECTDSYNIFCNGKLDGYIRQDTYYSAHDDIDYSFTDGYLKFGDLDFSLRLGNPVYYDNSPAGVDVDTVIQIGDEDSDV